MMPSDYLPPASATSLGPMVVTSENLNPQEPHARQVRGHHRQLLEHELRENRWTKYR